MSEGEFLKGKHLKGHLISTLVSLQPLRAGDMPTNLTQQWDSPRLSLYIVKRDDSIYTSVQANRIDHLIMCHIKSYIIPVLLKYLDKLKDHIINNHVATKIPNTIDVTCNKKDLPKFGTPD